MNINELKDKAAKISDEKFGKENPVTAPILKMVEEIGELLDDLKNKRDPGVEFADCFLLLVDAFRKYYGDDVDMQFLIDLSSEKLDIVAKRKWVKTNKEGVYKHVNPNPPKSEEKLYQFTITNINGYSTNSIIPCADWLQAQRVKDECMRDATILSIDVTEVDKPSKRQKGQSDIIRAIEKAKKQQRK